MKYLWEDKKNLRTRIKKHSTIVLFLDFDGTLTPIVNVPSAVRLPSEVKNLLKTLNKNPQIFLTIISGRAMSDLAGKVGLEDVTYSGNHGLEWKINGKYYFLPPQENTKKALDTLRQKLANIENLFPGAFIEDKGLTISVHYRLLKKGKIAAFKKHIKKLIHPFKKTKSVSLLPGKKVLDICPRNYLMKAQFCRFLLKKISKETEAKPLIIYVGDDTTDEDVFLHLEDVISIHVGKNHNSRASYYLHEPPNVIKFLEWIIFVKSAI